MLYLVFLIHIPLISWHERRGGFFLFLSVLSTVYIQLKITTYLNKFNTLHNNKLMITAIHN